MLRFSRRIVAPCLVLLSSMVLIGCSSKASQVTVQGKVTLKGQPLNCKGVRISFIGPDNKSIIADVAPSGEYTATVLTGDNLVAVSWQAPPEAYTARAGKPKNGEPPAAPPEIREPPASPIPVRYANPGTSGLACVIEADKTNTYNVDLSE